MVEQLAPGVWYLDPGLPSSVGANAYLVDDGEVTLVDAGLPFRGRRLEREIVAAGFAIGDLDRVLLTHFDLDHVGGLGRLAPNLEAVAYLGAADLALVRGDWHPPWLHHKGLFHRVVRRIYRLPTGVGLRPVADGDTLGGFTAHHTPGHNPGHMVYVHPERDVAFLGDLVWRKPRGLVTPVWFDSYDMSTVRASVRSLTAQVAPFEIAGVGHGTPLRTGGWEALQALSARCGDR